MRRTFLTCAAIAAATVVMLARPVIAHAEESGPRALTLWWVIFNKPDACLTNPGAIERCGEVDVFGEAYLQSLESGAPDPTLIAPNVDAGLAVLHATGGTTLPGGRVRLVASIYRSPAGGLDLAGPSLVDPMGLGRAFDDTGAEVHLVVRDHGARVPGEVHSQILNFLEPFCSDPNLGWYAGTNVCADVQFAMFAPGESGEDSVYAFADPSAPLAGARATLIRNGDMLQAIVETRVGSPQQ